MQQQIDEENKNQLDSRKSPNLDFFNSANRLNSSSKFPKLARGYFLSDLGLISNRRKKELISRLRSFQMKILDNIGQATQAIIHGINSTSIFNSTIGNLIKHSKQVQQQNQGNILAGSQAVSEELKVDSIFTGQSNKADQQDLNINKNEVEELQVSDIQNQKSLSKTQQRSVVKKLEQMSEYEFQLRLHYTMDRICARLDKISAGIDLLIRSQLKISSREQLIQEYKLSQSNFNMSKDGLKNQNLNRQKSDFLVDSDEISQINAEDQESNLQFLDQS